MDTTGQRKLDLRTTSQKGILLGATKVSVERLPQAAHHPFALGRRRGLLLFLRGGRGRWSVSVVPRIGAHDGTDQVGELHAHDAGHGADENAGLREGDV